MFFIRLFLVNYWKTSRARLRERSIYFAIELSLREISYVRARAHVRSRDAQFNT